MLALSFKGLEFVQSKIPKSQQLMSRIFMKAISELKKAIYMK